MRYLFLLSLLGLTLNTVTACNTVHGAGEDISKGGQAIERGSDRASDRMHDRDY